MHKQSSTLSEKLPSVVGIDIDMRFTVYKPTEDSAVRLMIMFQIK
jgi:hypothetical protein